MLANTMLGALTACLVGVANGHVMLYYWDAVHDLGNRPVRNAPEPHQDGVMSATSPCGGRLDVGWGVNGHSEIRQGEWVTMKMQWNGGHKKKYNRFVAFWGCDSPNERELAREGKCDGNIYLDDETNPELIGSECSSKLNHFQMSYDEETETWSGECEVLDCPKPVKQYSGSYQTVGGDTIEGFNHYCPAPDGNRYTAGYTVRCRIPETAHGGCTVGLTDYQRGWGGCYDLNVLAKGEPSSAPPLPPTVLDMIGTYYISEGTSIEVRPSADGGCCQLTDGTITITKQGTVGEGLQALITGGVGFCHNPQTHMCEDIEARECKFYKGCNKVASQCVQEREDGKFWLGKMVYRLKKELFLDPITVNLKLDENGVSSRGKIHGILNEEIMMKAADGVITFTNEQKKTPKVCDGVYTPATAEPPAAPATAELSAPPSAVPTVAPSATKVPSAAPSAPPTPA